MTLSTVKPVSKQILYGLKDVLGDPVEGVALHEPLFIGNETTYLKQCIDTGYVSSVGTFVDLFEMKLAEAFGVKYAVVTVNGTAALHICLLLAGVMQNDEVLVPSLTFIATANAVSYCGAVPHFLEARENDFGIDPVKLRQYLERMTIKKDGMLFNSQTGRRIAALMPMHVFGHPVAWDEIHSIATEYGIPVIEDAAESVGSYYKDKPAGSLGLMGALSFNGNKILTTGGGGAILTNHPELAKRAKHLTTTAKLPHRWAFDHDEVGYNYRMPNINAALGCAQLEKLNDFVQAKRSLAALYQKRFADSQGFSFFSERNEVKSNYWLNSIVLDNAGDRDKILNDLHENKFLCRPIWTPLHKHPMYRDCPRMALSITENLEARIINIPSSVKHGLSLALYAS